MNHKEKKYENLESNIFGAEKAAEKPQYNTKIDKAAFGTTSDWTVQGGQAKVDNKNSKVNTYRKKQQQQQSSVFELTDYSEHAPMQKSKYDLNNMTDNKRKKDHMYSDIMGSGG